MLRWRLILGALIIAALVGLCRLDAYAATPGVWLMPIVLLLAGMATQETLGLLAAIGSRPLPEVVHPIVIWSIVSVWLAACGHSVEAQLYSWCLNLFSTSSRCSPSSSPRCAAIASRAKVWSTSPERSSPGSMSVGF